MPDLPVHLWYAITNLGGAGLTLPLALAIALWLAAGPGTKRVALNLGGIANVTIIEAL